MNRCARAAAGATGVLVLALTWTANQASAQDSRLEVITAEQAKKAATLKPPEPDKAERIFLRVKENLIDQPSGFFPYFDSVYGGGGFTLGAGYRQFYGDNTFWDVKGLYSIKSYKLLEVATVSRDHAGGRLAFGGRAGWRDATQVGYYGLGMSTSRDARANYRFKQAYVAGLVEARPIPWVVLSGGMGFDDYALEEGTGNYPSIEEVYTPETAPGLQVSPQYVHVDGTAAIDWRTSPGYSRRGGYYGVSFHDYYDREKTYSFSRADVELIQHIPVLRETWVLSLRGRLQTQLDDDDITPYFLLPSLGSGSTLRGYDTGRFRDKHSLLMSAEWRWIPNRLGLDMALFYDAGMVKPELEQLGLEGMKSDFGIGIRFHGPVATPLRIELARGNEGLRIVFSGGPSF
jgi:hypothetical protein